MSMILTRPELELPRRDTGSSSEGTHEFVRKATIIIGFDDTCDFICNGMLDGVDVQAAVTLAGALNGNVYFLEGTYTSAAEAIIDVPSGVVIEGSSDKTVTFNNIRFSHMSTSVNTGDIVFRNFKVTGDDIGYAITVEANDCTIDNILIENVEATITGSTGKTSVFMVIADDDGIVENVRFYDCKALNCNAVGFMLFADTETGTNLIKDVWLENCETIDCVPGVGGWVWIAGFCLAEGVASFTVENIFVISCKATGSWESGFHQEDACIKVNVWYINCTSNDNGNDKPAPTFAAGFLIGGASAIGCMADSNGLNGFKFNGGTNTTIMGNVALSNGSVGIRLVNSDNNDVSGNTCNGNTSAGIHLETNSDGNTVSGNTCQGNGSNGIGLYTTSVNNTVTGNTCNGNTDSGIKIDTSDDNTVTGNTCSGNSYIGIFLDTALGNTVSGNTCLQNVRQGIYLNASDNNTVTGNTCNENDSGDTGSFSGISLSGSTGNLIGMNTCKDNDQWGIMVDADSDFNKVSNNYTSGNTSGSIRINNANCDKNQIEFNTVEEGAPSDAGTTTRSYGNYDPSADAFVGNVGAAPF